MEPLKLSNAECSNLHFRTENGMQRKCAEINANRHFRDVNKKLTVQIEYIIANSSVNCSMSESREDLEEEPRSYTRMDKLHVEIVISN